jgi:hypothetical protein
MAELERFVTWLPDLEEDEKFYCCLFARKKYAPEVPYLKSDKSQLKRFTADKQNLIAKLKQLECPLGWYLTHKSENPIPQEALAVYISPNPRNLWRATIKGIADLAKCLDNNQRSANPHQETMSSIQRTCSRRVRVQFDIDTRDDAVLAECVEAVDGHCDVLMTRGGYHIFVYASRMKGTSKERTWHQAIAKHADVTGDSLMPIPGCYQGGFTPHFVRDHADG